jgi:hypothetical protein
MSKIRLQSSRVMAGISQRNAAGMAPHMRMRLECQPSSRAGPLDRLYEAGQKNP